VQVEVVDEDHRPVAQGREGAVRTRGPGMATQYLGDPQGTAENFRDGWFYPGDMGRFDEDGCLRLTGRMRELMNIGGVKLAPDRVDELFSGMAGVRDIASFALPAPQGDQLCIAVVPGEGFDEQAILSRYRDAFPKHAPPRLLRVEQVPRNEMRKVQRSQLVAMAQGKR
jgi:acyl-CoA synthetase (AMP-forming)/AMP-acid ligase II